MKIAIVNGPNLNLLGQREPEIYGNTSFETYFKELCNRYPDIEFFYYQSNSEGGLIDYLQEVGFTYNGSVLNAGGYSHTSVAILDTLRSITVPTVEVHLSNVMKREPYRHVSLVAQGAAGSIFGFGLDSYRLAVEALICKTKKETER